MTERCQRYCFASVAVKIAAAAKGAATAKKGTPASLSNEMQTRADLYQTIRLAEYEALDPSIVATVLPSV